MLCKTLKAKFILRSGFWALRGGMKHKGSSFPTLQSHFENIFLEKYTICIPTHKIAPSYMTCLLFFFRILILCQSLMDMNCQCHPFVNTQSGCYLPSNATNVLHNFEGKNHYWIKDFGLSEVAPNTRELFSHPPMSLGKYFSGQNSPTASLSKTTVKVHRDMLLACLPLSPLARVKIWIELSCDSMRKSFSAEKYSNPPQQKNSYFSIRWYTS